MSAEAKYDGEPNVSEAKGEENGREFKDDDEGREFLIIPESLPTSLAETRKGEARDMKKYQVLLFHSCILLLC
jgi:hypothetical protein